MNEKISQGDHSHNFAQGGEFLEKRMTSYYIDFVNRGNLPDNTQLGDRSHAFANLLSLNSSEILAKLKERSSSKKQL